MVRVKEPGQARMAPWFAETIAFHHVDDSAGEVRFAAFKTANWPIPSEQRPGALVIFNELFETGLEADRVTNSYCVNLPSLELHWGVKGEKAIRRRTIVKWWPIAVIPYTFFARGNVIFYDGMEDVYRVDIMRRNKRDKVTQVISEHVRSIALNSFSEMQIFSLETTGIQLFTERVNLRETIAEQLLDGWNNLTFNLRLSRISTCLRSMFRNILIGPNGRGTALDAPPPFSSHDHLFHSYLFL